MRKLILEALTYRYYRIRDLSNFRCFALDDQWCVSAEYDLEGKRIQLFTAYSEYSGLSETAQKLFPFIAEVPKEHDVLIDFYLFQSKAIVDPAGLLISCAKS